MLTTLRPLFPGLNRIFVLYTPGRPPISHGRPGPSMFKEIKNHQSSGAWRAFQTIIAKQRPTGASQWISAQSNPDMHHSSSEAASRQFLACMLNRDKLRVRTIVSPISNGTGDSFLPGRSGTSTVSGDSTGDLENLTRTHDIWHDHKANRLWALPSWNHSFRRLRYPPRFIELVLIDFVSSEIQFKGNQCSFAKGRVKGPVRHKPPVQQLPDQWPLSTPLVNSQAEVSVSTAGIDTSQLDGSAEHIRDGGNDAPDARNCSKKSQGVKSIPDIEDGYTDAAVTLPDRFKMPHIDYFDWSGDPMVHLSLFSDVLCPMGLTRLQKLSLFGRTLSGIAAIWYAKLEDSVKRSWEEMVEAFVAQYSYNTQIEITTRDLETTRQEPKESFSEFVARWRAKASMMTIRPTDKVQIRMVVHNLQPKLM
ncbi:hypothetical protein HYC85_030596 [Camellia sinensis]|uniref:Retrotransposon gag domain-containing protein n=1 Tax=Camellia sinensis TaxID=4442 RepID=A0A7J7G296_CAMSI|nr:hypothetical protein HYC85_030596 [Camellia sinensis]